MKFSPQGQHHGRSPKFFRAALAAMAASAIAVSLGGPDVLATPASAASNSGRIVASLVPGTADNLSDELLSNSMTPSTPETDSSTGLPPEEPSEISAEPGADSNAAQLTTLLPGELSPAAPWGEHTVTRIGGADRYEAAAAITRSAYPLNADSVIIASGEVFSDALSAAPLSAKLKAPLLLVEGGRIPSAVSSELARLKPQRILIVGGPGTISESVQSSLGGVAPNVQRIWGEDRYSTSVKLAEFGWPEGASSVFFATGTLFADALSSAAAAAKVGGPVVLVPGQDSTISSATRAEITRLNASQAYVVGGPATVSPSMEALLSSLVKGVTRFGGSDRFEVSSAVTTSIVAESTEVYWASGYAFADALAGAAAAGARGAALLLVEANCIPTTIYNASDRFLPGATTILGGTATISNGVRNGNECMTRPTGISDADWASANLLYARVNEARFEKGISGLRIASGGEANSAQERATQLALGRVRPTDTPTVPRWVRYQVGVTSGASIDRVQRAFNLMHGYTQTSRWLYQPSGGVRGFVDVGYYTNGGQSGAALFFGAGS